MKIKNLPKNYFYVITFLLLSTFSTLNASAQPLTVDHTADDMAAGSLRLAIQLANNIPGPDIIDFNIPGGGVQTITLTSVLPTITEAVTILGYTQPGAVQGPIGSRTIMIAINGNSIGGRDGLFRFTAGASGSSLSGLSIYNSGQSTEVVLIEPGSSNIHIWGNYIGVLAIGNSPAATADYNGDDAVFLGDYLQNTGAFTNITIGTNGDGTNDANEGNVLSNSNDAANGGDGVQVGIPGATYTWSAIKISGNYIGVAADGVTPAPNGRYNTTGITYIYGQDGINIKSASNIIIGSNADGVSDAVERNIISSNRGNGIDISNTSGNISIAGNYIGTDKTGTMPMPNGVIGTSSNPFCGILATNFNTGAGTISNVVIGFNDAVHSSANAAAARNIISGNFTHGIQFFSVTGSGNKVSGNYIGVNVTGNVALGNGQANLNNGATPINSVGVDLTATSNILIGTNANGTNDVFERNVISGNVSARGVYIRNSSPANVVTGNYIGVGADGTTAIGNGFSGVHIDLSNNNRIGSNDDGINDAAEANIIANNANSLNSTTATSDGVRVTSNATTNRISRNIFYSNKGNPIDLSNDNVTVNDGVTVTTVNNPNLLLDYPVFTSFNISGGIMTVSGYVGQCNGSENIAGTVISGVTTVQVYKVADDGDQNGAITVNGCSRTVAHGEGVQYLGTITVTNGVFTNATFSIIGGATFASTDKITGITIDAAGNTSEFGVTTLIKVSGTVFDDANGNTLIGINEPGTTGGTSLYVYLVDGAGIIVGATAVLPNDTYNLDGATNTTYNIVLSTISYPVGNNTNSTPIVTTPPPGWAITGENGAGNTGLGDLDPNLNLSVTTGTTNTIQQNFGIEQLPDSDPKTQPVPYPAGGVITAGTVTTQVSGSDPEDGTYTSGINHSIVITTLPTNAMMFYNGSPVTPGQQIDNFDPLKLSFTSITNGSVNVIFEYAFLDAAGKQDLSPAKYTVSWAQTSPLPVTLLSFTGTAKDCNTISLNWKISDAINFSHFEIERSRNGINYIKAGYISFDPVISNYQFAENVFEKGAYQYRLKMIDIDGQTKYSSIVYIKLDCNQQQVVVFPNPARDNIAVSGLTGGELITLYDAAGKMLYKGIAPGYQLNINISSLTNGIYYLLITNKEGIKTGLKKIVKAE